jgi:formiminotetrahydrofolate cyclodeaminase
MQHVVCAQNALFQNTADELFAKIGAGRATPGSGFVAAVNGLLACEIIKSLAKITVKKASSRSRKVIGGSQFIADQLALKRPLIANLAQSDNDIYAEHILALKCAKNAKTLTAIKHHNKIARDALVRATETLLNIARECITVARMGLTMMRIGYGPAKGDAAVGVSSAVAGATGALCVVMVNIKAAKKNKWVAGIRNEFEHLYVEALKIEALKLNKVTGLKIGIDKHPHLI